MSPHKIRVGVTQDIGRFHSFSFIPPKNRQSPPYADEAQVIAKEPKITDPSIIARTPAATVRVNNATDRVTVQVPNNPKPVVIPVPAKGKSPAYKFDQGLTQVTVERTPQGFETRVLTSRDKKENQTVVSAWNNGFLSIDAKVKEPGYRSGSAQGVFIPVPRDYVPFNVFNPWSWDNN